MNASVNCKDKRNSKDWHHRTRYGFAESRREICFSQNIWIRNMHDSGRMKRAQEPRADEVSVQKSKRKMQDDTSSILQRTPKYFQDVESNCSGRLFHVSSQFVMILRSCSMLSHDKRLPLDTWNYCVSHTLHTWAEMDRTTTILSVDGGTFDLISRNAMMQGLVDMQDGVKVLPFCPNILRNPIQVLVGG